MTGQEAEDKIVSLALTVEGQTEQMTIARALIQRMRTALAKAREHVDGSETWDEASLRERNALLAEIDDLLS